MLDFSSVKKIHFLGVGGVSMSSLARFFHEKGYLVTGTDATYGEKLVTLNELGISVWTGFEPTLVGTPDVAVYSSAISDNDVELAYLRSNAVPCLERRDFLPYVCSFFDKTVAISGTHGKTTVTSMCAEIMKRAKLNFYAHIGGKSKTIGDYYYSGNEFFLTEACEYRKSMLSLSPYVSVVLNAEVDHPDTYNDKSDVFDAFDDFLGQTRGLKITCGDGEYYRERQCKNKVITFGFTPNCVYRAVDIKQYENACFGCQILRLGIPLCEIKLRVSGRYNLINAVASACVCHLMGISAQDVQNGLCNYCGVARRFEYVGDFNGSKIYSDYAHHPTEITETINTARLLNLGKITLVFQPHTYSRTARLKKEFLKALNNADCLIILKEYPAREKPSDGTSALALFRECTNAEKYYADNVIDLGALIYKKVRGGVLLVVGAGDVNTVCQLLNN